jgi:hypothetical protein
VTATLRIPANASPGGHYGVIRFTGIPPELAGSGVSLSASVGSLTLVRVSGNVTEQGSIAELYTSQNGKKRSLFEYGPITISLRFKNFGNVHLKPKGTVQVSDMFAKTTASFAFNSGQNNVLPQSIRKFDEVVNKKLLFGRYKVQTDIVYGTDNKIVVATTAFWVIPYKLIVASLLLIAVLVILVLRYNSFIVKRSQKKQSNGPPKKTTKKKT